MHTIFSMYHNKLGFCETPFCNDKTILVTAHGAIIKALLVVASKGEITYFDKNVWINNGQICILEFQKDGWKVLPRIPLTDAQ